MDPITGFLTSTVTGNLIMGVLGETTADQILKFWNDLNIGNHDLQNAFKSACCSTFSSLEIACTPPKTISGFLKGLARGEFLKTRGEKELAEEFSGVFLKPFFAEKKFQDAQKTVFLTASRELFRYCRLNIDKVLPFSGLLDNASTAVHKTAKHANADARKSFKFLEGLLFTGQKLENAPNLNEIRKEASKALFDMMIRNMAGEVKRVFTRAGFKPELFFEFLHARDMLLNGLVFHLELTIKNDQKVANIMQEYRSQERRKERETERGQKEKEREELAAKMNKLEQAINLTRQAGVTSEELDRQLQPLKIQLQKLDETNAALKSWNQFAQDCGKILSSHEAIFGDIQKHMAQLLDLIREQDKKLSYLTDLNKNTHSLVESNLAETRETGRKITGISEELAFLKNLIQDFRKDISLGEVQKRNLTAGIETTEEFDLHSIFEFSRSREFELGRGAVGEVYRAVHRGTGRPCALKLLKEEHRRDKVIVTRFLREGEILKGIRHQNVVGVEDVGGGGRNLNFYIQMELVEGRSLRSLLDEKALTRKPDELLGLMCQICSGVEAIHKNGIIHRDINPNNIMVTGDGIVKLMDFGVARIIGLSGLTMQGQVLGTSTYMSPEQRRGEALDFRSDIYALGLVLYEMFTFRLPENPPRPIRQYNPAMPGWLDYIITECLVPARESRKITVEKLRKAVEGGGASEESIKKYEDVFMIFLDDGKISSREEKKLAEMRAELALPPDTVTAIENRAKKQVFDEQMQEGMAAIASGDIEAARNCFVIASNIYPKNSEAASELEKLNQASNHASKETPSKAAVPATIPVQTVLQRESESDGTACKAMKSKWREWGLLPEDSCEKTTVTSIAKAPSGNIYLHLHPDKFCIIRAGGRNSETLFARSGLFTNSMAVSDDETMICLGCSNNVLKLLRIPSGEELHTLSGHTKTIIRIMFTKDGKYLVSAAWDGTIRIFDTRSGDEIRVIEAHPGGVRSLAVTPDERRIISGGMDKTIKILDFMNGREIGVLSEHRQAVTALTFAADSGILISTSHDGFIRRWDLDSNKCIDEIQTGIGNESIIKSPDGTCVLAAGLDRRIRVFDLSSKNLLATLLGNTGSIRDMFFTDDNTLLASGMKQPWDTALKWYGPRMQSAELPAIGEAIRQAVSSAKDTSNRLNLPDVDWRKFTVSRNLEKSERPVAACQLSHDGLFLYSAEQRGIRVWQTGTFEQMHFIETAQPARNLTCSDDGKLLFSSHNDWAIRAWDTATFKLVKEFFGHTDFITCMIPYPGNSLLLSTSNDGTLRLWDCGTTSELRCTRVQDTPLTAAVLLPRSAIIACTGSDRYIRTYDCITGREINRWEACKQGSVSTLAVLSDEKALISGGTDGLIKFWNVDTGELLRNTTVPIGPIRLLTLSPDERSVFACAGDKSIRCFDAMSGTLVDRRVEHSGYVLALKWEKEMKFMVSFGQSMSAWDSQIKIWNESKSDLSSHELPDILKTAGQNPPQVPLSALPADISDVRWKISHVMPESSIPVICIAASPDGNTLAISSKGILQTWHLSDNFEKPVQEYKNPRNSRIERVTFSPDGRYLAGGGICGAISIWETGSDKPLAELFGHYEFISFLEISPDGRFIFTASNDGTFRIWDMEQRLEIHRIRHDLEPGYSACMSPDCHFVCLADASGQIRAWDLRTGAKPTDYVSEKKTGMPSTACSNDVLFLVTPQEVEILDLPTLTLRKRLFGGRGFQRSVAVSLPGSGHLVFQTQERDIAALNCNDGSRITIAGGFREYGTGLLFFNNGRSLITNGAMTDNPNRVRVWQPA